jgi:hypothetical protein
MGYYTNYSLEVRDADKDVIDAVEHIILEDDQDTWYALQEGLDTFGEECKWYDHDEDMKKLSIQFPKALFVLTGDGEESGDQWITYYRNGKMQKCEAIITYDDFDPKKLK